MQLTVALFGRRVFDVLFSGDDADEIAVQAESLPIAFTGCVAELAEPEDSE